MSDSVCGLCSYSCHRPTGEAICYSEESKRYSVEVDYHDKSCDGFESLSDSFVDEIWG